MTTEFFNLLVTGSLMPMLVAVVVQSKWPSWVKGIAVVVTSIVVGTLAVVVAGDFTGRKWYEGVFLVWAAAIAAYNLFWRPTGIAPWLEKVSNVSNLRSLLSLQSGAAK